MKVNMWLFEPNDPSDWIFDGVYVDRGRRILDDWIDNCSSLNFIKKVTIPLKDDGREDNTISFINTVNKALDYKEGQNINTVNVYRHPNYSIQAMYIDSFNCTNSDDFNYFGTIVNIESMQIFGKCILFKVENSNINNLTLEEALSTLINFYYVKSIKLNTNRMFEQIAINNYEPEINAMFDSYYKSVIGDWIILSDDKDMLEKVKEKDNKIEDLNNIIWFKYKTYMGDVTASISEQVEHNKESDFRGLYMDIDESYIRKVFF